MKVFWSWQSDTQGKTGRHFIRNALADAIAALKEPEVIEEPRERDTKDALHLDHDREGVSGSPDLARLILDKIAGSTVFIADVTPVSAIQVLDDNGELVSEKRNMNPNVAIELGYAMSAIGDECFLMVMNTHYGDRRYLPFDLAHKAGPIMFNLPPNADKASIAREAANLKGQFVTALRPFLKSVSCVPVSTFPAKPSTTTPAIYFDIGEALAELGDDDDFMECSRYDGIGFYLKVSPLTGPSRPFSKAVLKNAVEGADLRPLSVYPSGYVRANRYGAIVFEPRLHNDPEIRALTQVFESGEMWGLAPWLLATNEYGKLVPTRAFETVFRDRLRDYVQFLKQKLDMPLPYSVQAGAVGLKGFRVFADTGPFDGYGPIHDDEFRFERVISDASDETLDQIVLGISEGLFELTGYSRPLNLFGFPPQSPLEIAPM